MNNKSTYITTYTKRKVNPLEAIEGDIVIEDVAHSLSLMTRANGHFAKFYSVGQHSINCAKEANARGYSKKIQLACLLHDASEAYISDITRPIKKHLPLYLEIEDKLQNKIWLFLGVGELNDFERKQVFDIDDDILYYEFLNLMDEKIFDIAPSINALLDLNEKSFRDVEIEFIELYNELIGNESDIKINTISKLKSEGLKQSINEFESKSIEQDRIGIININRHNGINKDFLSEIIAAKEKASQIDIIMHSIGIMYSLPNVLEEGEVVEYLSLGAGNTGRAFDLETNYRIAEFKFSHLQKGSNAIRENEIFKDFINLLIYPTAKIKYLYTSSYDKVIKFFNSHRALNSILNKASTRMKFYEHFGDKYLTVNEFFNDYKNEVIIYKIEI